MDWLDQLTNVFGSVTTSAADAYVKVKNADALAHQQRAYDGSIYTMGQFDQSGQPSVMPIILLMGVGLLAVMLIKD